MKKKNLRRILSSLLFAIVSLAVLASAEAQVTAVNIYAVTTGNQLVRFNSLTPGTVTTVGAITGLQSGENILGIDFRPATGELYALGSSSRLYTINKATGAIVSARALSVAISGTAFGVDFNPTVDRLRIISDTGQNLRVDPISGATTVDGALNGGASGADAAGYTNSFNGATSTALYSISSATDTVYLQNPPNNGTLVFVGSLGVDAASVNGFDIVSTNGAALAAMTVQGSTGLYSINTTNGAATLAGLIGTGSTQLSGFAVETAATANYIVYGLTTANNIVRFNSSRPNTILRTVAVTGLQSGENLLGIDFRPATGKLFGLGSSGRIYTVDKYTGVAILVGPLTTALSGTNFGFDFNPVPDRIRITSDAEQNLRANPADGSNVVDGSLAYAAGDANAGQNPNIVASGYTNSFGGATSTTLYNIDSNLGILTNQNPPNNGTLNTIGKLGISITGEAGLDIAAGNNTALAALQTAGSTSSALYAINLVTGSAAVVGPIGGGAVVRDIAIFGTTASNAATATIDFDGDGRTDYGMFGLNNGMWRIKGSATGETALFSWGVPATDVVAPGDYDGDGKTDVAVWRETTGIFYVIRSSDFSLQTRQYGVAGDEPMPRDYDGDGITDFAVVRRSANLMTWYIINSSNSLFRVEDFGVDSDVPAPGDYDGDGRFDIAVRRGSGSNQASFYIKQSLGGYTVRSFGIGSDLVVPGDYDGDGITDLTAVRPGTNYTWYYQGSTSGFTIGSLGNKPDLTVQGDYNGDGRTDIAIFDPVDGAFRYTNVVLGNTVTTVFGQSGEYPVANYDTH